MRIASIARPMTVEGAPVTDEIGDPVTKTVEVHWYADKAHPLWALLKPLAYSAALGGLLWATANSFDANEIKTIVGTFVAGVLFEGFGIKRILSS